MHILTRGVGIDKPIHSLNSQLKLSKARRYGRSKLITALSDSREQREVKMIGMGMGRRPKKRREIESILEGPVKRERFQEGAKVAGLRHLDELFWREDPLLERRPNTKSRYGLWVQTTTAERWLACPFSSSLFLAMPLAMCV